MKSKDKACAHVMDILTRDAVKLAKEAQLKNILFIEVKLLGFTPNNRVGPRIEITSKKTFSDGSGWEREHKDNIFLTAYKTDPTDQIESKILAAKSFDDLVAINPEPLIRWALSVLR